MSDLVRRLRDPAFGTETSERNLMEQAAARIEALENALRAVDDEHGYGLPPETRQMIRAALDYRKLSLDKMEEKA